MTRIFFTIVYFLVLQNFLWNEVFADSGFSNDFIEQAKDLGINIGQGSEKPTVKLPEPPKPEVKPDARPAVKLPEPPKPEVKPDAKPTVKLPELPKLDVKPDARPAVKLPEPPKPEVKPDAKPTVKLPEPPKLEVKLDAKPTVKLPEPPKPEVKPDAKPEVKLPEPPKLDVKPNARPAVKLPEPPKLDVKSDAKPAVKLPEPPKPEVKPDAKPAVKLPEPPKPAVNKHKMSKQQKGVGKVGAELKKNPKVKKSSKNKKQQSFKKSNNIKDDNKLIDAAKKPIISKTIPKKKSDKSISYFIAPEKNIDNNFNPKNFMRRKPYNYNIKPPQYLLDMQKKGAKNNIPKFMFKDELSKLLFVAVNAQNIGAIKGLLLKGANINAQNKANEYTPLMYAVENSKLDSLRYLILRGANPNIVTSNKMSALHLAAITSNLKALRILLSADSDIFIQDKYHKTFFDYVEPNYKNMVISDIFDTRKDAGVALMDFCILGSLEGVKFSLQNKANINSQNHNGDTPLILAVRHNNPQLVTYLLSVGADATIKNKYKNNAKAVAKQNKYKKILDILETIKFNKHLHLLGISDNIIPYELSNKEKKQIEKNKKEIEHKDFDNYPSQGVLGTISKKPKK